MEPTVNLSLGGQGVVSSVVSVQSSVASSGFVPSGQRLEASALAEASTGENYSCLSGSPVNSQTVAVCWLDISGWLMR